VERVSQRRAGTILRFIYPAWVVFGIFGIMYVPSVLVVADNAAKTASNLQANEFFFRVGIAANLVTQLLFIFAAFYLYILLSPVKKDWALLMLILALVAVPIAMLNEINNIAALAYAQSPQQMSFFLDLHTQGVTIASIFWGLWLFPLGLLVTESGYFPKIIGWAVLAAAVGYTADSFLKLLVPGFVTLSPVLQIMTFGEVVFLIWLVVRGPRLPRNGVPAGP